MRLMKTGRTTCTGLLADAPASPAALYGGGGGGGRVLLLLENLPDLSLRLQMNFETYNQ